LPDQPSFRAIDFARGALGLGILLSRPLASVVAAKFGWHSFFAADAVLLALVTLLASSRDCRISCRKTSPRICRCRRRSGGCRVRAGIAPARALSGVADGGLQHVLEQRRRRARACSVTLRYHACRAARRGGVLCRRRTRCYARQPHARALAMARHLQRDFRFFSAAAALHALDESRA